MEYFFIKHSTEILMLLVLASMLYVAIKKGFKAIPRHVHNYTTAYEYKGMKFMRCECGLCDPVDDIKYEFDVISHRAEQRKKDREYNLHMLELKRQLSEPQPKQEAMETISKMLDGIGTIEKVTYLHSAAVVLTYKGGIKMKLSIANYKPGQAVLDQI